MKCRYRRGGDGYRYKRGGCRDRYLALKDGEFAVCGMLRGPSVAVLRLMLPYAFGVSPGR